MTFRTHQRHVKILKQAKGFRGRAKNCYTIAVRQVHRKWQKAYVGRKLKKRDMKSLWIQRINAGARMYGLSYNQFISQLNAANVHLNRKVLAELAVNEPASFKCLCDVTRLVTATPTQFKYKLQYSKSPEHQSIEQLTKSVNDLKL